MRENIQAALEAIPTCDFLAATKDLLNILGYQSERTLELSGDPEDFIQQFPAPNENTRTEQTFRENAQSVRFIFQLTSDEIAASSQQNLNFEAASFDKGNTSSFIFSAVELKKDTYARGQYAQFTREINKRLSQPSVVLFRTPSNLLTLAFVHRRPHKRDNTRNVLDRVTLIKDIRPHNPYRAHLDTLAELSLSNLLTWMSDHNKPHNFDGLLAAWLDKLDTQELNRRFYRDLYDWFECAIAEATFPKHQAQTISSEEHIIRLITRLLFVWFIKEKRLIAEDLFIEHKVRALLKNYDRETGDSYYRAVLQNLFFATLNTEIDKRRFSKQNRSDHRNPSVYRYGKEIDDPNGLIKLFEQTPFINGGLFDCLDSFEGVKAGGSRLDCFTDNPAQRRDYSIPNRLFFGANGLITLFENYKFTVEENTPIEQEVALDPELLGKVFENLLAAYNPETRETARKQTGSYYTPRPVVDYMVDETLMASLAEKCQPTDGDMAFWRERLRYLLDYEDAFDDANELFEDGEAESIVRAIADIKVLDPAVGSGAFPMGMLHKLTLALRRLDPKNKRWEALQKERAREKADAAFETRNQRERDAELLEISETFERYSGDFGRKLYLIQNSIFGVDIQPIACQIAKLRFFISLAIEQEPDKNADNFGIKPLPNLETRFVVANTLLALNRPVQLTLAQTDAVNKLEQALIANRERYFHATTRQQKFVYKEKDKALRGELATELEALGFLTDAASKIANWDPYDQNASADWFDAEYMFGIRNGFDVIIGNPPYVSHDKISKQIKAKIKNDYQSYQPFADVYCYFIEKAVELQSKRGILSFITSNSYLRAEYGAPIRSLLRSKNTLLRMLNIEDSQVFESAIVNVAIIVSRKSINSFDDFCIVVNSPFSGDISFEDFVKIKGFTYSQMQFNSKSWNLVEPKLVELQKKLESSGKTLEQLKTKIRLGIATGSNEAFLIDEGKKRELCEKDPVNSKIIKPILRGRDISRYNYTLAGQHILLAKNGVNIKKDYPEIYKHLESFGDKFKNRGAQGQHWTNLRACSFYDDFKKEKIVWIELTDLGRFALCNEEVYLLNSAYFLLPPSGIDSKFLLGVLNSKVICFYLNLIAETSGMGTSRWINKHVKEFPIPMVARNQQTPIIQLVDQILEIRYTDPMADITEQEREIDRLVYALYGLTEEEIAAVENV